jgi:lipopolysaccharide heptosyltransferase I
MVLNRPVPFKPQAEASADAAGELPRPQGAGLPVPSADLATRDFKRILLIKLSAVGDVVQTIPLLNALRRRYPDARLDWLVTPAIAELLAQHPAISSLIEFPREQWSAPFSTLLRPALFLAAARLIAKLRAAEYDLVLDLQGQLRTAVLAFATGAPVRIGFDRPRAALWNASPRKIPAEAKRHAWQGAREGSFLAYTDHIVLPTLDLHPVERYLRAAQMLGIEGGAADFSFPIPPEAATRIDALLDYYNLAKAKLLVIAPGSNWDTKQWRSDAFAEVARHFLQKKFGVILIGSQGERALCEQVAALAPGAIDLAGETTLPELAALLRRANLCVSNDSGPMHMAAALERPVIGIFGPTDPVWAGPYRRADAVLRAEVPCAPCYLRQLSRCPHGHVCMKDVAPRAVIERAEQILAAQSARPKAPLPQPGRR